MTDFGKMRIPDAVLAEWQGIIDMMAEILQVPAGLIMRIDEEDIKVFVASGGKENPYKPGDGEHLAGSGLYCETVIKSGKALCVPDALKDPDWKDNPDVKLDMISYLGFPIYYPDKSPFGTICVLDGKPNAYSDTARRFIEKLRDLVQSQLELLCMNASLGDSNKQLTDYLDELHALRGTVPICAGCKKIRDKAGTWRPVEKYILRYPDVDFSHSLCPDCYEDFIGEIEDEFGAGTGPATSV